MSLAFSGGTDSSLLAWAAAAYGRDWRAYLIRSPFQPAFELADARQVASLCGLPLTVLELDLLQDPEVSANPPDRCYFCKRRIFSAILQQAETDGYHLVIDGTNASDPEADRPGMRALQELGIRSPLRECGLAKADVRALCRKAGLPVWNKPAYACLATRVPAGTPITQADLERIEAGESLLASLGFRDFRIRLRGGAAVLQFPEGQQARAWEERGRLQAELRAWFPVIALDLAPRPADT